MKSVLYVMGFIMAVSSAYAEADVGVMDGKGRGLMLMKEEAAKVMEMKPVERVKEGVGDLKSRVLALKKAKEARDAVEMKIAALKEKIIKMKDDQDLKLRDILKEYAAKCSDDTPNDKVSKLCLLKERAVLMEKRPILAHLKEMASLLREGIEKKKRVIGLLRASMGK